MSFGMRATFKTSFSSNKQPFKKAEIMARGKTLYRSKDGIIAGVCGGLADYFDFDPTLFRIIYTILTVCTAFSGVIIYLICWFIMPRED